MTTTEPIAAEPPQLALWPELAADQPKTGPNFPDLPALRAHLRAAGAADWADNPTLTQSASRRLAVIRPEGDYGWLLIAPGPALYLHAVSRCDSRRQALALCKAVEDHIQLPWDQPGTAHQLAVWRSATGESLWGTIVHLRGTRRTLDTTGGLYAGLVATHRPPGHGQEPAEQLDDGGIERTDELEPPVPAETADAPSSFSRSWGHVFDGADLLPRPPALPPRPRRHPAYHWYLCAGCREEFGTEHSLGGGDHASSFCARCRASRRAGFDPQPGDTVRLLDPTTFSKFLIQSIDGDMVKLRLLGAPDKAPFSVHIGELDPMNSPSPGRKDPKGAA